MYTLLKVVYSPLCAELWSILYEVSGIYYVKLLINTTVLTAILYCLYVTMSTAKPTRGRQSITDTTDKFQPKRLWLVYM